MSLRVLMLGAFDPAYPRHHILRTGLEANGAQIVTRALPKTARTFARALLALRAWPEIRRADVVLVPAFNQTLGPVVWALGKLTRVPVVIDYMVGLSDVAADRRTVSGWRLRLYRHVDRFNLRHLVALTDTAAHRDWFVRAVNGELRRMHIVPVGVKPEWLDAPPLPLTPPVIVQFIGTYIPFQGVDVILHAADLLRDDERIRFELIGRGQTLDEMEQFAAALRLPNVTFRREFVALPTLLEIIGRSSILLGVFGAVEKTYSVVPNKVYDGLAAGRAVITADSPALREVLTPGVHLIAVPAGDPAALADSIRALAADPARIAALGSAGRAVIRERFLPQQIGTQLLALLKEVARSNSAPDET